MIAAVVFDLDGVLIDSEQLWDQSRREVAAASGVSWPEGATVAMQGMSAPEWSRYMRDEVGVPRRVEEINDLVLSHLLRHYRAGLPLLPGAVEAVSRLGARWPLGLASSSNRVVIDEVLTLAGLASAFGVTVSSEEVERGKPSPDVYLEAARRLGVEPGACAAVEDSGSGIRSAVAAAMKVVDLWQQVSRAQHAFSQELRR
ncbi:MAG TPA: HAD family phosphatase, partial [Solirubrobacterales bacterium]|nr:HAD family phosphatase [Solirubrobacterales bacterium]